MSTLIKAELISEARILAKEIGADNRMPNKALWSIIDKHITWLVHRDANKLKMANYDYLYQTIKCVDVIEAPTVDPCCGIRTKCTVNRTRIELPELFEDGDGVRIKSVYSIDGSTDFTKISVQDYMRKIEDPNSLYDKARYYFFNNGYLYFPKSGIRKVMIKGHFKQKVSSCCEDQPETICLSRLEEDAFIPGYLRGELMQHVKRDLLERKQIQEDTSIDKNENKR